METDRQAAKATHWKTAVFDGEGNTSGQWTLLETLPLYVKEVHKKKEVCPETGKEHYQIHVICHRQVRLTQMTSWLKYTKWFPVIGDQHIKNSIAYVSKVETTAPGAQVEVIRGTSYLQIHEILMEVGRAFKPMGPPGDLTNVDLHIYNKRFLEQHLWKNAARFIVQDKGIEWITKLACPTLEKNWNIFYQEIFEEVAKEKGALSLKHPLVFDL
jgi:hypothetical protein